MRKKKPDPDTAQAVAKKKSLVETRALAPAEQQRVERLLEKQRDDGKSDLPLFELKVSDDGKKTFAGVTDPSLSATDAKADFQARLFEVTGCAQGSAGLTQLLSLSRALVGSDQTREGLMVTANALASWMEGFHPRDSIEVALVGQIVVCQHMAAELIGKSVANTSCVSWANSRGNLGSKLLARSQNAIQQLISYRRGGQQKVTVEHVHVHSGGRAIVGHVEHNPGESGASAKTLRGTP